MLGDYAEALRHAELSMARRPAYTHAHVMKVNALLRMGRPDEALKAIAVLHHVKPGFRIDDMDWQPFADRKWNDELKRGVIEAGQ